ncbi:MAG: molybdopterin-dependent oxidoreductase [Verrucomicrobiota bacterium]
MNRRLFLRSGGLLAATFATLPALKLFSEDKVTLPFTNGERSLVKYPQKRPLIRLTSRPPQLETPFSVFNEGVVTPNDAFFVRYHLSDIPLSIDPETFRLEIKGLVESPLTLSLEDLKSRFESVELIAVCQCSGNGRGLSQPRVAGGQLGNGAMGNAKWKGVRLKDLLDKTGIKSNAKQVTFNGLDKPIVEKIPDYVKALDIDHACGGEVMLAYEMNGEPLPMLNGYPLRLVVPGYFGTYWVKHLNEIIVVEEPLGSFWMNPAYRIPDNDCGFVEPGSTPGKTKPITRLNVRSFITNYQDGDTIKADGKISLNGIAFDAGFGIKEVLYSLNNGRTWEPAALRHDLGKYSFREWETKVFALRRGKHELKVRAINRIGQTQPLEVLWNSAGYMRNVVETVRVEAI